MDVSNEIEKNDLNRLIYRYLLNSNRMLRDVNVFWNTNAYPGSHRFFITVV